MQSFVLWCDNPQMIKYLWDDYFLYEIVSETDNHIEIIYLKNGLKCETRYRKNRRIHSTVGPAIIKHYPAPLTCFYLNNQVYAFDEWFKNVKDALSPEDQHSLKHRYG